MLDSNKLTTVYKFFIDIGIEGVCLCVRVSQRMSVTIEHARTQLNLILISNTPTYMRTLKFYVVGK